MNHKKDKTSDLLYYLCGWWKDGKVEERTQQGVDDRLAELDKRLPPRAYAGDVPKWKNLVFNGKESRLPIDEISYEQICKALKFDTIHNPTVVYHKGVGGAEGTLHHKSPPVQVCDGMIFSVAYTGSA